MKPLPMPVRIAAGLLATAVEQARELPRQIVEFPVTAVSQALQASMRIQQKVTELAIKGDRALCTLRPVSDAPSWATFDEDEPGPATNGISTVTELRRPTRPADPIGEPEDEEPSGGTAVATAAGVTAQAAAGDTAGAEDDSAGAGGPPAGGPNILPGYEDMTIPQLRARLRKLSVDDLRVLLDWETAHRNRPPFVTMLGNRITTVTEE
ncbi:lipid droplet-associated protein [Pseudonocardia bannensis]|uniref:Lipid droplet-associated protein n=1 Tax=Pseudonocardia bannensis TaxID=630973 RepID=A0A848DFW5_9PSEU|nr:lipid droplet-associated protein [Pseudonocardia bannensis]NMH91542.1 lipid droplet-associated protein [Pseudonocardia bannensis]